MAKIINHTNPGQDPVPGDLVTIRRRKSSETKRWPPDPEPDMTPAIEITLSHEVATVAQLTAEQVTADVAVRLPGGELAPITGEYDVPIMKSAVQEESLVISVVDGQASSVVIPPLSRGTYTIDFSQIYPRPTSRLPESPVLRVRGG